MGWKRYNTRDTGRRFAMRCAVLLLALVTPPSTGWGEDTRHYKVEAAFLYNFFSYITWPGFTSPESLKNPVICVEGTDPVQSYLEYIQHKISAERSLSIRKINDGESLEGCHLYFSRNTLSDSLAKNSLKTHTLTVSDSTGHLDKGGMIELSQQGERIAMKINHSLLYEGGFQVSSRLLNLAQKVQ